MEGGEELEEEVEELEDYEIELGSILDEMYEAANG